MQLMVYRQEKYGEAPFWSSLGDYFEHCQTGCPIDWVVDNGIVVEEIYRERYDDLLCQIKLPCGEIGWMLAEDLVTRMSE